jgi:hypothetical protein
MLPQALYIQVGRQLPRQFLKHWRLLVIQAKMTAIARGLSTLCATIILEHKHAICDPRAAGGIPLPVNCAINPINRASAYSASRADSR